METREEWEQEVWRHIYDFLSAKNDNDAIREMDGAILKIMHHNGMSDITRHPTVVGLEGIFHELRKACRGKTKDEITIFLEKLAPMAELRKILTDIYDEAEVAGQRNRRGFYEVSEDGGDQLSKTDAALFPETKEPQYDRYGRRIFDW